MTTLRLDYETYSDVDLRTLGLDIYSAHPSTRVLMAAYQIDEGPVQLWEAHKGPVPVDLKEALLDPSVVRWAFNSQFERVITRRVLGIKTPYRGWRCTMSLAYLQSFKGGLGDVGEQMGLDVTKDKDGSRLIRLFSMPQKVTAKQPHRIRDWRTDPDDWNRFGEYCRQDVVAETEIWKRLSRFPIPESEWDLYELDQRINDRGKPVDLDFVRNAIAMSKRRQDELVGAMRRLTGLDNPNSVAQFLPWLQARGYPFPDLNKDTVAKVLREGSAPECEEALRLRQWAARLSVKKYDLLATTTGRGDRKRFLFQFAGASRTARWCLAGGTPVLVRRNGAVEHVPIEDVLLDDEVWDGETWVAHDGVVYSGFKPVVQHDGVTATPDHVVYLNANESTRLSDAKADNRPLWRGAGDVSDLQADGSVRSMLRRLHKAADIGAVAAACSSRREGCEDPPGCGNSEVRGRSVHNRDDRRVPGHRGGEDPRDARDQLGTDGRQPIQRVGRGRGLSVGGTAAQRFAQRSCLAGSVQESVVGRVQGQSGAPGAGCGDCGAGGAVAGGEPGEGRRDSTVGVACCRGEEPWRQARAEQDPSAILLVREADVLAEDAVGFRRPGAVGGETRDFEAHRHGSMGAADDRAAGGRRQANICGAQNPQRRSTARRDCKPQRAVGAGTEEHRPYAAQEETEGGASRVLDTRAESRGGPGSPREIRGFAHTYDILNAGPRNRFMAAGRIVSNSGRSVQTQNLPRTPKVIDPDDDGGDKLAVVSSIIREGDYEGLCLTVQEPMEALVGCVRSAFGVKPGKTMISADLASIESAVIGWLFDVERLLRVFREKMDPYKDFGTVLFKKPYDEVTKAERNICKPPVLGCGYRLGGGDLRQGRRTGLWGYAENMGVEMTREQSHAAVTVFRDNYPEIVQGWYDMERAVKQAMSSGGPVRAGKLTFERIKPYMTLLLPSGRRLYYFQPRIETKVFHYEEEDDKGNIVERSYTREVFTYMGQNQDTGQWTRLENHGGRWTEQSVQATARDVLAAQMMKAHAAGYHLVAHIHDEAVAEQDEDDEHHSLDRFIDIMRSPIDFAPGLPLGAAGWSGSFYRK